MTELQKKENEGWLGATGNSEWKLAKRRGLSVSERGAMLKRANQNGE